MNTERQRFEALFREHYTQLNRYVLRRLGPEGAQEVVSETFLVAWRRLDDVPDEALPWLYATARRVMANERRRWTRASRLTDRIYADGSLTPADDHADAVAERLRVQAALESLGPKDREALLLTEWEQLSAQEAATVLGCTTATFHVRLHRARRRIAALLHLDDDELDARRVPSPTLAGGTNS